MEFLMWVLSWLGSLVALAIVCGTIITIAVLEYKTPTAPGGTSRWKTWGGFVTKPWVLGPLFAWLILYIAVPHIYFKFDPEIGHTLKYAGWYRAVSLTIILAVLFFYHYNSKPVGSTTPSDKTWAYGVGVTILVVIPLSMLIIGYWGRESFKQTFSIGPIPVAPKKLSKVEKEALAFKAAVEAATKEQVANTARLQEQLAEMERKLHQAKPDEHSFPNTDTRTPDSSPVYVVGRPADANKGERAPRGPYTENQVILKGTLETTDDQQAVLDFWEILRVHDLPWRTYSFGYTWDTSGPVEVQAVNPKVSNKPVSDTYPPKGRKLLWHTEGWLPSKLTIKRKAENNVPQKIYVFYEIFVQKKK